MMVKMKQKGQIFQQFFRRNDQGTYFKGSPSRGRGNYRYWRGYRRNNGRFSINRELDRNQRRPSSPVEGSEEYMARKIKLTSAIIMRQLLSPEEPIASSSNKSCEVQNQKRDENKITEQRENKEKQTSKISKTKRNITSEYNVKEIHDKIMNRIANLNDGRKKNFINAYSTGLDVAIDQIQKQKRLELSRVLRDMCSSSANTQESGELINSIVPDIGIKLEELPLDVIEELRCTLSLDYEEDEIPGNNQLEVPPSSMQVSVMDDNTQIESKQIEVGKNQLNSSVDINVVEIKAEDITDNMEYTANNERNMLLNELHTSLSIKDEYDELNGLQPDSPDSIGHMTNYSKDTEPFVDSESPLDLDGNMQDTHEDFLDLQKKHCENSYSQTDAFYTPLIAKEHNIESCVEAFTKTYACDVSNLKEVSEKMHVVEECIKSLTKFRQSLFKAYCVRVLHVKGDNNNESKQHTTQQNKGAEIETKSSNESEDKRVIKKKKLDSIGNNGAQIQGSVEHVKIKEEMPHLICVENILKFPNVNDKISVIQRVQNQLVIATEAGKVICISLTDVTFVHTLRITSVPLTCLQFVTGMNDFIYMFVGSLDRVLKIYNFKAKTLIKALPINGRINCMDSMWGFVFLGCEEGTLVRYSVQREKIEFSDNKPDSAVMVIKAAQEGPRRVLLVGCREGAIYMRCAITGLHLRSFTNEAILPTVNSLILNGSYLYCGTSTNSIIVFSFHDGHVIDRICTEHFKGISCIKIFKNLLFVGCYNGSVCVYNLETRQLLTVLSGPGGGVLSMELLDNQVIVGTLSTQFGSIPIPNEVLSSINSWP